MRNETGDNSAGNHIQVGYDVLELLTYANIQGYMWRIWECGSDNPKEAYRIFSNSYANIEYRISSQIRKICQYFRHTDEKIDID